MQSRSYLFLGLVLVLTALSGYLYTLRPYKYGLDVKGGVRFTYEMDPESLAKATDARPVIQERIQNILEGRAAGPLAVTEPLIAKKGDTGFIVELPGFSNVDEARTVLSTTARIEWYHATTVATQKAPFRPYQSVNVDGKTPEVHFQDQAGKIITPKDPQYRAIIKGWKLIVQGDELAKAEKEFNPATETYNPIMHFSREGARKMEAWTRANTMRGEMLAAVLDNKVLTINPLQEGAIISSTGRIDGRFDNDYIFQLVDMLNSGALPVTLIETSSMVVDPTIGNQALEMIVQTGLIAFAITGAFLVVYYVFPGFIALIALALYVLFTITALKFAGQTFSLASIAGFILSIGMAVDANILVFERVKEEMREGRSLMTSIELGFKRTLPAIIDSNACTILTSMVLAQLGTGPVKGFAVTLIIGVAISLFTAVVITRSLLIFLVGSGLGANPKWYGLNRQWFGEGLEATADKKPLPIIENRNKYFIISLLLIVPGIIAIVMGGIKPNVEFQGGYEAQFAAPANLSSAQISDNLEKAGIEGANVKFGGEGAARSVIITVPESSKVPKAPSEAQKHIATSAGLTDAKDMGFTSVGASVRNETIRNAVLGVVLSSALIVLYLAIRFGLALGGFVIGLRFAFSAISALLHDVVIVIGLAALGGLLFGWEVSALFITAMLTVIGFSTHDTIVIFDRIRENLRRPLRGEDIGNLINRSVTQSVARSINTGITVIATLILLIVMGSATPDLKLFNAAMLCGILAGTYSSIFNAAPILYLWDRAVAKKKGEHDTMLGHAAQNSVRTHLTTTEVAPATGTTAPGTGQYGQVRRRASSPKGHRPMDD